MANKKVKVKRGMGGSRCGRERSEKTADMKSYGKKARRIQDDERIREGCQASAPRGSFD